MPPLVPKPDSVPLVPTITAPAAIIPSTERVPLLIVVVPVLLPSAAVMLPTPPTVPVGVNLPVESILPRAP